jgi:hypothetical protein
MIGVHQLVAFAVALARAVPGAALQRPPDDRYEVARTGAAHGDLVAAAVTAWAGVPEIAWGPPSHVTRFRAVWTTGGLYVRFDASDAHPWFTMTTRDAHLWDEEVVEIFLDPASQGHHYAELEISPGNVVCDVRMVRPWPGVESDLSWNIEGLETRVVLQRNGDGKTLGWIATAFLPWMAFRTLPVPGRVALPPRPADTWRFNVYRIERPGGSRNPKAGAITAAWSPTGRPSFHVPAAFRAFVFR